MENLAHSLVGLAVAEAMVQLRRRGHRTVSGSWRDALVVTSIFAANIPDIDVMYASLFDGNLGYLLHHRGHTHTLLGALPLALLVLVLPWLRWKRRVHLWSRGDWLWLAGAALLGPVIHFALDWLNSYGVHPFWPIDNRWYYGDRLFVVEPWLWLSLVPFLVYATRSLLWRSFLLLVFAVGLALIWMTGYVPPVMAWIVSVWAFTLFFITYRVRQSNIRLFLAALSTGLVLLIFSSAGKEAKARFANALEKQFPGWQSHDLVMSPLPSNPLCWSAIGIQTDPSHSRYAMRQAMVAPYPKLMHANHCPDALDSSRSPRLVPSPNSDDAEISWGGQYEQDLATLRHLYQTDCKAAGFLLFGRAPLLYPLGIPRIISDLRYERADGGGFTEVLLDEVDGACPRFIPPWVAPRQDILKAVP